MAIKEKFYKLQRGVYHIISLATVILATFQQPQPVRAIPLSYVPRTECPSLSQELFQDIYTKNGCVIIQSLDVELPINKL